MDHAHTPALANDVHAPNINSHAAPTHGTALETPVYVRLASSLLHITQAFRQRRRLELTGAKINVPDVTACVDLDTYDLHQAGSVSLSGVFFQVQPHTVPAGIQRERSECNERLDACTRLLVADTKSSPHTFVVKDLCLKQERLSKLCQT